MILHYRLIEEIGRGGMGVVYKAEDTKLARTVAIKFLPRQIADNEEERERFKLEARAAAALNHPGIATIYAIEEQKSEPGESDDEIFIVMEYIEGQELHDLIVSQRDSRLPVATILHYAIQIAGGLQAAHEKGIIHRDIKSSNIMIIPRGRGEVKIMDFGLAKVTGGPHLTKDHSTLGTAAYMSPEQIRGEEVDHRTDIWSFGVVLYELLTGKLPFNGEYDQAIFYSILNDEPAPIEAKDIHDALPRLIKKALAKNREDRYQDFREILQILEAVAATVSGPVTIAHALPGQDRVFGRFGVYALAGAFTLLAGFATWLGVKHLADRRAANSTLKESTILTSYPGNESNPRFSPDGNQVAFEWNGEDEDNYDIYIKMIGTESMLRITDAPEPDFNPVWSPDGRAMAFMRALDSNRVGIFTVSALGGPETRITEFRRLFGMPTVPLGLAWHPSGDWIATSDQIPSRDSYALFLISLESGEKRQLTVPPGTAFGDSRPTFSPDGLTILFIRTLIEEVSDLYILRLTEDLKPESEPQQLTFDKQYKTDVMFINDGREVMYSAGAFDDMTLWRTSAKPGKRQRQTEILRGTGGVFSVSPQTHSLVYTISFFEGNIWRLPLQQPRGSQTPERLISSTRLDYLPRYSPDGQHIAFTSTRTRGFEVWVCHKDGRQPRKLTSFGGPTAGTPRWSPDGTSIVMDGRNEGQSEIYTINAGGGQVHRLTTEQADDMVPSWSGDGQWIYFVSDRSGENQVWKMPAAGGEAVRITKNGGFTALESPDGKSLYYAKIEQEGASVWQIPISGGEEKLVIPVIAVWGDFTVTDQGVYYLTPDSVDDANIKYVIKLYRFGDGTTQFIADLGERQPVVGIDVSPDGAHLLFTRTDRLGSDLYLVEESR